MARDLRRRSPMSLLLFVVNFERHVEHLFVLSFVCLKSVQFVAEVLLFIEQLLKTIREDNVSVVETAILLVEVVIVVDNLGIGVF